MHTAEQFWSHVQRTDTCWLWLLSCRGPGGYPQVRWEGEIRYAHHIAWELSRKRPIPLGKFILHKCDNKQCVRPKHLYYGTRKSNSRDFMERQWHKHNKVMLCPEDVREMRRRYRQGDISIAQIAREHPHVKYKAIQRAITGQTWRHVR